jgi:tetratricopeptide (TPR) repeat protein
LGITLKELGRLDDAEASYTQAIALKADYAEAHYSLGVMLQELGRLDESEASYTQAIALKPDYADAYVNLGATLRQLGRQDDAEANCRKAIALKPDYAEAHCNLGVTFQELGRLDEAEASYKQAIALKADYAEAHYNLGITLKELGRLDGAEASYTQAIALKPGYAEAHNNLGVTLQDLGRFDEAEASSRQAIALKPDLAEAHCNLGAALKELGRLDEAEASSRQAIALNPNQAEAQSNLGNTLQDLGRLDESIELHNKALACQPGNAKFLANLSTAKAKAVSDWHIPMMNEHGRNEAYQKAMNSAIQGGDVVLDIGTGAGLLSMIAADCGAKEIITCEMSKTVSEVAKKIIQKNGFDHKIKVINKNSKDLILGQDINKKADILVSEILSSEFVGEGIQATLLDAKKRLLKKTGKIIPEGGSIMIALIENTGKLAEELFADKALGYDIGIFNSITTNKWLATLEDEPAFLSDPIEAFTFDFCNFENIYRDKKTIKIEVNRTGSCAGVIQWLKVKLYDDIEYQNNPLEMHRLNSVSGWKTPIFKFNDPVSVTKGQSLDIQATLMKDYSWFHLDHF